MTTIPNHKSSVTLLHKGLGPSLFQLRNRQFSVVGKDSNATGDASSIPTPRSPSSGGRPLSYPPKKVPKRTVVKCMERQDANSMFTKRLEERAARHYRPPSGFSKTKAPVKQQQCELFVKERLFTNKPHKPAGFPPPNFMPRWNPRHRDRTYLSQMVLEDPWSLSPEKRAQLKQMTGLRLKSISRHYQYKVGANLPYGKNADSNKCTCFVNFCDHCKTSHHDRRCPLHMQLLDAFEPDCKTVLCEFCPFQKNVEDLPLDQIRNPRIYVDEVIRRLKAGELQEVPPFPSQLLLDDHKLNLNDNNINPSVEASTEALDYQVKKFTDDSVTQTEPFIMDMDMKAAFKENICQTQGPSKTEPYMVSSILLRSSDNMSHYKPCPQTVHKFTQVTPCLIESFNKRSRQIVKNIAKQTITQALQEITNETRIQQLQRFRAHYTQRLVDLTRTTQFKYLQEKWRNNAYTDEQFLIEQEALHEKNGEQAVCAVAFCISYLWNFPGKVLDTLRREGFLLNEGLKAMKTVVKDDMNNLMEEKLRMRDNSIKLLDEMINHALFDLEMDAFRGKLVDEKYIQPLPFPSRFLREIIAMRDNNFEMIRKIIARLLADGWYVNEDGELVRGTPTQELVSTSSSEVSLNAFLKGVRVSVDSHGNPKYLVDSLGKALPINVRWLPLLQKQIKQHTDSFATYRFDLVLSDTSLKSTSIESTGKKMKAKKSRFSPGDDDVELDDSDKEEGQGLDFDYLGSDGGTDDDDDVGRVVFKRRDDAIDDDEYELNEMNM